MIRRTHARRAALAVVTAVGGALLAFSGPSDADVTAVKGSAYGYSLTVSLFGGPNNVRGVGQVACTAPNTPPGCAPTPATSSSPSVVLPPTGGNVSETDPDGTSGQVGPAIIFSSGPITVSSQGTLGPSGSVTSSTDIQNVNASGNEVFTASRLQSSCTASETGVSGSTTVTGGRLQTSVGDPNVDGDEVFVTIPVNPPPNTAFNGAIENVGDNFQAIFNEQIINPDGSITVYAYHLRLLGPTAVGDLYVGKSECGVTAVTVTTTSSSTTTSTSTSTTSTTLPPTTTSTSTSTTSTSTTSTSTTSTSTSTTSTSTTSTSTTMPTTTSTSTSTTAPTTTSTSTSTTAPTTTSTSTSTTVQSTTSTSTTTTTVSNAVCDRIRAARAAFNAQITATEATLAQTLSGAELAAAIAELEAARATGNAQYDEALALANCGGTAPTTTTTTSPTTTSTSTTTTTTAPPTSTTTIPSPNEAICESLREQLSNPFFAPFIQQLLIAYGCV